MGRFSLINRGVAFSYRLTDYNFAMQVTGEPWRCKTDSFVSVRLEPAWFAFDSTYYDGHTLKSITVLGVQFAMGYTYDSRPVADWEGA